MTWSIERAIGFVATPLRAVGYIVSELIPAQALRCVLDRDYADAMYHAAAKHDGAEQLNEREAEEEVAEPRMYPWGDSIPWPPSADLDDAPMASASCSQCGQPYSASACGPSHAVIAAERGEVDVQQVINEAVRGLADMADYQVPKPHEPALTPDELVAVRQLIEPLTGPTPLSEALARTESNEVGVEPEFNAAERTVLRGLMRVYAALPVGFHQRHTKPPAASAEAAGSPEAVSSPPREPASGHLTINWLTPAICEVLAEHHPTVAKYFNPDGTERIICRHNGVYGDYPDRQGWRDHVAPLIAAHILKALAAQPK